MSPQASSLPANKNSFVFRWCNKMLLDDFMLIQSYEYANEDASDKFCGPLSTTVSPISSSHQSSPTHPPFIHSHQFENTHLKVIM